MIIKNKETRKEDSEKEEKAEDIFALYDNDLSFSKICLKSISCHFLPI